MAKGAIAKEEIAAKILELFPNAFKYDKEIRIPIEENGETIQIKVTLTYAKTNVESGADTAMPGDFPTPISAPVTPTQEAPIAPTESEKESVAALLKRLGL